LTYCLSEKEQLSYISYVVFDFKNRIIAINKILLLKQHSLNICRELTICKFKLLYQTRNSGISMLPYCITSYIDTSRKKSGTSRLGVIMLVDQVLQQMFLNYLDVGGLKNPAEYRIYKLLYIDVNYGNVKY